MDLGIGDSYCHSDVHIFFRSGSMVINFWFGFSRLRKVRRSRGLVLVVFISGTVFNFEGPGLGGAVL